MHWIVFALLATVLFACNSVIDKHLIDRHFKYINASTITVLAALAGVPFLIGLLIFGGAVPDTRTLLFGFLSGWMVLGAYQLYYRALRVADASLITTLFQLILPFNYIFGIVFLNEHLTLLQLAGVVLIVIAASATSIEEREESWKFRWDVILLMTIASLLISLSDLTFKHVVETTPFIEIATAEYMSSIVAGLLLLAFMPSVRTNLKKMRGIYKKLFFISESNEFFTFTGSLAMRYAIFLGPIALVQGIMGAQSIVVLAIARLLAFFFPALRQHQKKSKKYFMIEVASMVVVVAGGIMVSIGSS